MEKLVTDEAERAAADSLRKNIEPVVKEALTEDVLDGIKKMVGLIPAAVDAIEQDLKSTDPVVRQKAYTELLKHTSGNRNLVPDINADKQREMNVYLGMPRPTHTEAQGDGDSAVIESKQCDACQVSKPLTEFVAGSDRCSKCFNEMRAAALSLVPELGETSDG